MGFNLIDYAKTKHSEKAPNYYRERYRQLTDPARADDFYNNFGKTEYDRQVKYYGTKAAMEEYGINQSAVAPGYSAVDDMIDNQATYEKEYGKSGFNKLYTWKVAQAKNDIDNINNAIKLKESGTYSADILNTSTWLKDKFTYDRNNPNDTLRQQMNLVPEAFDAEARNIIKKANEIRKSQQTPKDVESGLTSQYTVSWDDVITGNKPVTEKDLLDAIQVINGATSTTPYLTNQTTGLVPQAQMHSPSMNNPAQQGEFFKSVKNAASAQLYENYRHIGAPYPGAPSNDTQIKVESESKRLNQLYPTLGDDLNYVATTLDPETNKELVSGVAKWITYIGVDSGETKPYQELYTKIYGKNPTASDMIALSGRLTNTSNIVIDQSTLGTAKTGGQFGGGYGGGNGTDGRSGTSTPVLSEQDQAFLDQAKKIYYNQVQATISEGERIGNNSSPAEQIITGGANKSIVNAGNSLINVGEGILGGPIDLFTDSNAADRWRQYQNSLNDLYNTQIGVQLQSSPGYEAWHGTAQNIMSQATDLTLMWMSGKVASAVKPSTGAMLKNPTIKPSIIGKIAPSPELKFMLTERMGSNIRKYEDMGVEGMAPIYAVLDASAETYIESLGGMFSENSAFKKGMLKTPANYLKAWGKNFLSEAGEEYLQSFTSGVIELSATGKSLSQTGTMSEFTDPNQLLETGISLAIMTGIFGLTELNSNKVSAIQKAYEQGNLQKAAQLSVEAIAEVKGNASPEDAKVFDAIDAQLAEYAAPARVEPTQQTSSTAKVRKGAQTMANTAAGTATGEKLQQDIYENKYNYVPESSKPDFEAALKDARTLGQTELLSVQEILDRNQDIKRYGKKDIALVDALWYTALQKGDTKAADHYAAISADMKTTSGQTVQTAANISRLTPEGFVIFAQRQLARLNAEGVKKFGDKWTNVSFTEAEQQAILKAPDGPAREAELEKAWNRIKKELPSTTWEKIDQVHKTFMLSNPATIIRNFGGNAIMRAVEAISKKIEGIIQRVVKPENRTVPIILKQKYRDMAKGSWDNGGKKVFENYGKYEFNKIGNQFKPAFKGKNVLTKAFNAYSGAIGKAMEWGDLAFAKPAYETALARYLQAKNLDKITPEATEYAMQEALEVTYRDFSKFAQKLTEFQKNGGIVGKATTFITPFAKTPTNIARRAFEYSEAGLIKTVIVDTVKVAKGSITPAQYIKNLSRGLAGSTILTGLGYLLGSGILPVMLTGDWSDNQKERELQKLQGFQPFSLKIGDTYVSISWAQPVMTPIMVGSQIAQAVKEKGSILDAANPLETGSLLADGLGDLTVFKGVSDAFKFSDSASDVVMNIGASAAGQFVPSIFKKAAQTIDPTQYNVYSGGILEKTPQQIITSLPGAKETLKAIGVDADIAPNVDPFGKVKQQNGTLLERAAINFLSPVYITSRPKDPVTDEIVKLFSEIKSTRADLTPTDVLPPVFDDRLIKGISISKTEQSQLKQNAGQAVYRVLGAYINSPKYKGDSLDEKVKNIKKIYADIWGAYKKDFLISKAPKMPSLK